MKTVKSPQRERRIPDIFGSIRLDERFWALLDDGDPSLRAYVYRMRETVRITPALFTGQPFSGLVEWLRDRHGGGAFHVIIRRRRRMELSGIICIGEALTG